MKARRLFSVKDKDKDKQGSHRRNKSSDPSSKNHHTGSSFVAALFGNENVRPNGDQEKEKGKVEEITRILAEENITDIGPDYIPLILNSEYAAGDVDKAVEFLTMQSQASAGTIVPYNPQVHMVGAINRESVTCYLDSLLFAMFANMTAYEAMLRNEFTDEPRKKLVVLLRLWVNMLRMGKLVHTDMTKIVQDTLAECGWQDAKQLEQQDTSEAFAFITETLQLPLLQLQVDLFHQGKKDEDDHKIVQERLLNLAVPPDPEGRGVRLEDCLEEYFNTRVDVLREGSGEEKNDGRRPRPGRINTIRVVNEDGSYTDQVMASPIQMSPLLERKATNGPLNGNTGGQDNTGINSGSAESSRPTVRHRSTSVIQHVVLDDKGRPSRSDSTPSLLEKARKTSSTVVKAVTIPAWQFFRLIPWHVTGNHEPKNDQDVAKNFSQRPVVGICLKRYGLNERHQPMRVNTYIDIPDSLKLPHFMLADDKHLEEDPNGFSTEYKLVLQSVVCHRGDSVYSGHYIAFARVAPKILTGNRRHNFDPPPDYEEAQWVRFDDLEEDNRVTYVDDIKKTLKEEMPYLLFYQIVPIVEVAPTTLTETEPPSYMDSKTSLGTSTAASMSDSGQLGNVQVTDSDYFMVPEPSPPKPPSVRFSTELERPGRISFEEIDEEEAREGRLGYVNTARTPDTVSPAVTPSATPGEETTRDRFARAAALFTNKNRSRPTSQAGEGRTSMGLTMNRLGGLIRTSKETLRDPNAISASVSAPPPLMANGGFSGTTSQRASMDLRRSSIESESVLEGEEFKTEANSTPRKHGHKRHKSKVRGAQPERECSVM